MLFVILLFFVIQTLGYANQNDSYNYSMSYNDVTNHMEHRYVRPLEKPKIAIIIAHCIHRIKLAFMLLLNFIYNYWTLIMGVVYIVLYIPDLIERAMTAIKQQTQEQHVQRRELHIRTAKRIEVNEESQCSICLEKVMPIATRIVITHCKHIFHAACLKPWIVTRRNCPMCREKLVYP